MLIQYNTPQDHQRQKISLQKLDFPLPFALPATLFVKYLIGTEAYLEANSPNYAFAIILIFGVQVLASALLMAVILTVVYYRGLKFFGGLAIGGIVGLDILFLSFISGASMNPARSLAPALLSANISNLWLYWYAIFIGTSIVALIFKRKFVYVQQI
jgi:aquaporin Z